MMNGDDKTVKAQTRLHDVADILKTLSEWCGLESDRVNNVDSIRNHLQKENEDLKAQLKRVYAGETSSFWGKYDEKVKEVEHLQKEKENLRAELVLASTGMLYRSWVDSDGAATKTYNLEEENKNLKEENKNLKEVLSQVYMNKMRNDEPPTQS